MKLAFCHPGEYFERHFVPSNSVGNTKRSTADHASVGAYKIPFRADQLAY